MSTYHIVCLRPGMHRGGRANPVHAAYKAGDHTPAQFRDLVRDPNIVVIRGGEKLTEEHVAAMEAAEKAEAEKAEAEKAEAEKGVTKAKK